MKTPRQTLRRRVYSALWKANHEHGANIDRLTDAAMREVNVALRRQKQKIEAATARGIQLHSLLSAALSTTAENDKSTRTSLRKFL